MRRDVFAPQRRRPADLCEHCGDTVERVWLVPGDVLNSCRACYALVVGEAPVHEQGHSTLAVAARSPRGRAAAFHLRPDHRRPA